MEMRKTQILMSKPVCLGLSIKQLGKTLMYEFWYDYVKPKYCEKAKLCDMDTDRSDFIVYIKTDDIYKDIAEDVGGRLHTSNYELDWPLPKEKIKKVNGLMKDELGAKSHDKTCWIKSKNFYLLNRWR